MEPQSDRGHREAREEGKILTAAETCPPVSKGWLQQKFQFHSHPGPTNAQGSSMPHVRSHAAPTAWNGLRCRRRNLGLGSNGVILGEFRVQPVHASVTAGANTQTHRGVLLGLHIC